MNNGIHKPDLPLRLAFLLLKMFLISPFGVGLMAVGRKYLTPDDNDWVEVTRIPLRLPRLSPVFEGYRLVQISDFHIGTWADRARLLEAVGRVNGLNPDLIAITGDFVTHDPEKYESDLVQILSTLSASDGCVAVLGNHDHWSDPKVVRRISRRSGIVELKNSIYPIRRGSETLSIAGVDDIMEDLDDLPAVVKRLPDDRAAILLAHEPDFADESALGGHFDLQLSGHTHGGQVHFPRIGPVVLPRFGKKYPCGLYNVNGMHLYTNRGLGTAEIQFRYHCPAEISLFELHTQDFDRF